MFKVELENIRDIYFINHVSNIIVMSEEIFLDSRYYCVPSDIKYLIQMIAITHYGLEFNIKQFHLRFDN